MYFRIYFVLMTVIPQKQDYNISFVVFIEQLNGIKYNIKDAIIIFAQRRGHRLWQGALVRLVRCALRDISAAVQTHLAQTARHPG